MTTTTTEARPRGLPIPVNAQVRFLTLWHAAFAGGFLVAWLTGEDEGLIYLVHTFAGYTVLTALGLRLLAGLAVPAGQPLALPRPLDSLRQSRGRSPVLVWMAAVLLGLISLVAATGWLADRVHAVEDLHEGLAEFSPWVVGAHVAYVLYRSYGRKVLKPLRPDAGSRPRRP